MPGYKARTEEIMSEKAVSVVNVQTKPHTRTHTTWNVSPTLGEGDIQASVCGLPGQPPQCNKSKQF